ncbi:MAG TPA: AI-2E family transporter [Propionibacteriaceae bacterium]
MVEPSRGKTSQPAEGDDAVVPAEASAASPVTLTATAPASRRRPPVHLMSPFRIGFVGTLGVLVAYGLAQAIIQARSVLVLLVVAMFIALGLNPIVEFLIRRKLRRGLSVALVFIAVLAVLGLAGVAVVPVVSEQITNLATSAPRMLEDLLGNPRIKAFNDRFQLVSKAQESLSSGTLVQQLFGGILGAGRVVLGAVFSGVTLLILTLYFLASLPSIKNAIYRLTPASSRARVRILEDTIFTQISAFISGTFVVAMIAGTLSFIFLLIVGLSEYALALALVIAVFDIIPLIGATIGAIIVCIVAFIESTGIGIAAVIFYVAYQLFENYVLQPRVFKRAVNVPGALVVIAALIGAALLGVVGALLAVPVAAALLLLLRDVAQPRLDAG